MKKSILVISIILLFIASFIVSYKYFNSKKTNENTSGEEISDSIIDNGSDNNSNNNQTQFLNEDINLKKAKELLSTMTLEEKVGQMFFIRCMKDSALEDLQNYKVGGFILFDNNIKDETKESLTQTLSNYQSNSKIKLLIGIDEEGGIVNRLSWYPEFRAVPFYSPQELYNEGGYPLVASDTKEKAELLKIIGINMNLAPVCDVSVNPNDFIYPRTFGMDALETSKYIETVVNTMNENKIGSALKHFPGYGNNVDTHTGISVDERSYESFQNSDFLPFKAGIDAGASSILVSHNIVKSMDSNLPASLSPSVNKIIRNELKFDGVIMTDDLQMSAIKEYIGDSTSAVLAIIAGNDLIIASDFDVQIPSVLESIRAGEIQEDRINESVLRILKLKFDLGII
ncbi:glycoside hydrolase family 3 N-terminal domain-containing protein [Clostridium tertium]|uniref:glycoside hydrolase family 3 protein n=1 Tax=Clostridium tertium TaxID=1559 RepID=UPI00189E39B8|nr:glycoside hydrolase family 3 N-terminal domain-containing protein [Clostridium tertium]MDB1947563.1 glycoside hydrolase family 3 N-terminal domain-containing protein [Clostridium tertium]